MIRASRLGISLLLWTEGGVCLQKNGDTRVEWRPAGHGGLRSVGLDGFRHNRVGRAGGRHAESSRVRDTRSCVSRSRDTMELVSLGLGK